MKTKHSFAALAAFLFALLPATQAWGNSGSSTTYYAALKVAVASGSTGRGLVYAGTSNTAGTYDTGMTSGTQSSTTQNEAKTFYAFAQASDNYEFSGWSSTDGGSIVSTANPYSVSVQCSNSSASSPTTSTVYANFVKKQLAAFAIAFEDGDYTVNGGTPAAATAAMTTQTEATTITLTTSNENFYRYKIGDAYVYTASYTADIAAATTVSIELLTASQLATVSTLSDLQTALADGSVIKTTIPSGTEIVIPSGTTVTVPSGKILVVDGTLAVVGTLSNSGSVSGSGTLNKISYLISQGSVITPVMADGTECGTVNSTYFKYVPKYCKTTVSANSPGVSGTIGCSVTWGVMLNGSSVYAIGKQSPAALKVTVDSTSAVNKITGVSGYVDAITTTDKYLLLANCNLSGPKASNGRYNFQGVVDCAGKTLTVSGAAYDSNFYSTYLNGTVKFNGSSSYYFQNGKAVFLNCSSVTVQYCKNTGNLFYFYDCGTSSSPCAVSFSYYSSTRTSDYRTAYFYSGYYTYTFNSTNDSGKCNVYGGSFTTDPTAYIPSSYDGVLSAKYDGSKYYVVQGYIAPSYVCSVDGTDCSTLEAAIEAAGNGSTILLSAAVELADPLTIPAGKNITLSLEKHTISGGKIVNNGTLLLTDSSTGNGTAASDASGGAISCDIENNGTLDFAFGTYSGSIVNNAGTLTTHNGIFSGSLVANGGTVDLKGGHFATDVSSLVASDGITVFNENSLYSVCELPDGTMSATTISGVSGYSATPYSNADYGLLNTWVGGASLRTSYSSADWVRLAELLPFYQVFNNRGLDATLKFDRDTAANSVKFYAKTSASFDSAIGKALAADEPYRGLTDVLVGYNYSAKTYKALWQDNIKSVSLAVENKSDSNAGTVCTAMIELWRTAKSGSVTVTNTLFVVGQERATFGAGSNKAMIRPASGAAAFYATPGDAMATVADGGTVLLANDSSDDIVISRAGSFTFDPYGFTYTGTISIADGYKATSTTETESSAVAHGATSASAITYVVERVVVATVGEESYSTIAAAVEAATDGSVEMTVTAPVEETVELSAGKTLVVTVADGVEAQISVDAGSGAFVEAATSGATTTYVAKQITVELDAPQSVAAVEVAQVENGVTNEVTDVSVVNAAVAELTDNSAVARADNTDATTGEVVDNLEKIEVVPSAIVQETVGGDTFIRSATFEVTPSFTDGRAEAQPSQGVTLKFRLPVDAESTQLAAVVSHEGAQFGVYPVLSYNGEKFIEVESDAFSAYGYTLLDGETANPVAAIGTTGYASLAEAIAAAQDGDTVTLLANSAEAIVISSEIAFTLDTNGYTYSGSVSTASGYGIATSSTGTATTYTIAVDPYAAYVKVADGFYQNAATYATSTDFYITSKAGLEYFRDLVNGETAASYAYFAATGVTSTYPQTPAGINSFHSNNMFKGKTVHMCEDIDLAGDQWLSIGFNRNSRTITDPDTSVSASVQKCYFYGLFDAGIYDDEGNLTGTHVISNLDSSWQYAPEYATLESKYQMTGLFGMLAGGTSEGVKNLTVSNATVVGRTDVGVIAGRIYSGGAKIENCHVVGDISVAGSGTYVGGLVGECRGSIVNSSVDAAAGSSISGYAYVGGLAGSVFQYNNSASVEVSGSAVSNTTVSASYSGAAGVGALVGVTNPSGTYHGNVVISGNDANDVSVTASNASASSGSVGTLVGCTLYDDGAYAIVADNTVSGTTSATAGGNAVTAKMGAANDNIAVGENVTFDANGEITGGIFEVINDELIAEGYLSTDNLDDETSASYPLTIGGPYEAVIGSTGYATLAAAIAAAQDGDTVTLLQDVSVDTQINLAVPLTVDLNGKTITSAADNRVFKIATTVGDYVFKNGTVNTTSPCYGLFRVDNASTVTVEGITATNDRSWGCNFRIAGGAQVLVTNCTITATNGGGIYAEGGSTVDVYDSTIAETGTATDCNASAFAIGEGATLTVHSGTYSGEYGAFVCSSGGTIEILGGSVTGRTYAIESDARAGGNEDNSVADSLIKVSGGTIDGELHEEIQLYNSATLAYENKMVITGGTFLNYSATGPTADNAGYEISGGSFDSQVLASHCAAGYEPVTEADAETGLYTVQIEEGKVARNVTQNAAYTSLADAVAAANAGDEIEVFAGTFDCGSDTITIDKALTIYGQGKDETVLNFTATGKAAFSIAASNVTMENMTINQADTSTDNTMHVAIAYTGSSASPTVAYSDIALQNLKFTGGKYSLAIYAEDLTIDSCDFLEQGSSCILLYCVKGNSAITGNNFVQTSPSGQGFIYGTTASGNDYSSGTLTISGNTATGGRCLYHCNNQNYIDTTTKLTLEIVGNVATNYNNKAIVFAGHSDIALGTIFESITVTSNVLYTTHARPTIQRDDTDTSTLTIDATGNYWGTDPDFDNLIPTTSDKYLVMGEGIDYGSYYNAYDASGETLALSNPYYTITFADYDGTELQSSFVAGGATPAYAGETPTRATDAGGIYTFAGWAATSAGEALASIPAATAVATYYAAFDITPVVAQIDDSYYATFSEAITTAEAYYGTNGSYPTITVLDATAELSNADWKISDGYLVKKVYVAQIVTDNGATTNKYESLRGAYDDSVSGDTVELLADDYSLTGGDELFITHAITITGPVDANGDPLYTIYGSSNYVTYNDIFIKGTTAIDVTIENVKLSNFGDQSSSNISDVPGVIWVSAQTHADTHVVVSNVVISSFNYAAIKMYSGALDVVDCLIDCAKTVPDATTKGLELGAAATVSSVTPVVNVIRTEIINNTCDAYDTAAIEAWQNTKLTVSDCTMTNVWMGIYACGSSFVTGDASGDSVSVTVANTLVEADAAAIGIAEEGGTTVPSMVSIQSGTFSGGLAISDEMAGYGTIAISGGMFDAEVPEEYCADGYIPADADPVTGLYTVKVGSYVAQIGDEKYETFAEAIAAADAAVAAGDDDPSIVVIDDTATLSNADWKISGGYLVRKVYVAQIVLNDGSTTNKYESLATAYRAAASGNVIEMIGDDRLSAELTISKSVTITGAVDANGEPLYTIYGKPTDGYNVDILIKNASSAIDVTFQNLNIAEFGNEVNSRSDTAVLYFSRSTHVDTHVVVSNVTISAYNGFAMIAAQGKVEIVDSVIDGYKDPATKVMTGGIWSGDMFDELPNATVSVLRTTIRNTDSNVSGVSTYAIDARPSSVVTVTDCTITNVENGIAAIATQESGDGEVSVTVSGNTVVEAANHALAISGNPNVSDEGVLAMLSVSDGAYTGDVYIPEEFEDYGIIEISGGIFDREVSEDYCASGFIPTSNTDAETSAAYPYTVGAAAARIDGAYYLTLADAFENASDGDTVVLLSDVTGPCAYGENASVTLNLNGNTISVGSGYALSVTAGELTVTSAVDEDGNATGGIVGAISVSDGATLHITGGIYEMDWDDCAIEGVISVSSVNRFYDWDPTEVEAASAVFTSPVPYEYCADGFIPGAYDDIYTGGEFYYYVKEGEYLWMITDADGKVAYSEEVPYAFDDEEDWEYDWFGEHEMNRNGFTMTLLHDVASDDDFSAYVSGLTYTVDLGGYTVNHQMGFGAGACNVIITNGVVSNAGGTAISIANGAQVTLGDGLTVAQSTTGVYVEGGTEAGAYSKLTVKNGATINGTYGVLVFGSGSSNPVTEVVVEGGTITGSTYGISGNGTIEGETDYSNTRIVVSGGTISGGEVGIYHPQSGALVVSGGTISGEMAIYARSGTITVTDGNLNATGAAGEYDASYAGNDLQETGDAVVLEAVGYPGGNPTAAISGGTFTSQNGDGVASYAAAGQTAESGFVSGGTFSSEVPEEYCSDGYIPREGVVVTIDGVDYYTVKQGSYAAQIVRNDAVVAKYETFDAALEAALGGDTVQLLADVADVDGTFSIDKSITIDGNGHSITAAENTEPRSVVQSYSGARLMFDVDSAAATVTFKDVTLDGGDTHYYTFLVRAKAGTVTFEDATLLNGGEADSSGTAGVGYGAAVQVDGGTVLVEGDFYADGGGETDGVFPFTAILYQSGVVGFDDEVAADIGEDLLLVGMVGAVDVSTEEGRAQVEEMLTAMNVPAGFYPYTLKVGDSELTSFTGASPLGWNDIIAYGTDIMEAASSLGMEMDPEETPVEVGLLTDTVLEETFVYENSNFTVNGNGNALSGTIQFTDDAGILENVVLGTEEEPLVIDLTQVSGSVALGSGIEAVNASLVLTEEQATAGTEILTWDPEDGTPDYSGLSVTVEGSEEEDASLEWDEERGVAYIGPCEVRLDSANVEGGSKYTSLADALALAAQSGDTITLLMDVTNSVTIRKSLTLAGAWTLTGVTKVTDGAVVTLRSITLDAAGQGIFSYPLDVAGGAEVVVDGATFRGGVWCNAHLNGGSLTGTGATMVGDALVVNANGESYEYRGQTLTEAPFGMDLANVAGETVRLPFMDVVRENGTETVSLADAEGAPLEQGASLLLVANMPGIDTTNSVALPSRYGCYTLTLDAPISFLSGETTGWTHGEWNEIIETGSAVLESLGNDADEVEVTLSLESDVSLGETAFTNQYANLTVDGQGNALSGTVIVTDDAGLLQNIVLGTEDEALVLDLTQVTGSVALGSGINAENVTVVLTEEQAALGTEIFTWDPAEGAPSTDGVVVVVKGSEDDASLEWDEELGVAYVGPCEARLTGPSVAEPIYTSFAAALAAAQSGDSIKMLADIELSEMTYIESGKNVTLDLAGYTISAADDWTTGDCLLCVSYGGTLTVEDSSDPSTGAIDATNATADLYGAIKMTNKGDTAANGTATLVVNGGAITGVESAICGNGTRSGTAITVNGGTITSTAADGNAIFHPQNGTLTINDGSITGASAVYLKSGALSVTGGTLTGTAAAAEYVATGNGGNPTGDALIIDTCGYPGGNPTASITGGTFISTNAKAVGSYATSGETALDGFIPATSEALFSDADADGVVAGYELTAVDGTDPVLYAVTALPAIYAYGSWTANSIYYFADEDPIPARTTQATTPKYKRTGATSYVAVAEGDGITVRWDITGTDAENYDGTASSIATVDGNGLITFTEPGSAKVWVTMIEASGAVKTASKTVSYGPANWVVTDASGDRTAYASLYAAFNAAAKLDGSTITAYADVTVNNIGRMTLSSGNSVTLDLNGHTIALSQNYATNKSGSFITVKNGSLAVVDSGETKGGVVATGTNARAFNLDATSAGYTASLDIGEGVNVSSADDCCVTLFGNATLTTAGNLSSPSDFAIAGNGSAGQGGTTVYVTGGTVTGDAAAIYQPQDGTLVISDGTVTGDTAVYVKSGTVTVTGGTITGTGDAVAYAYNGSGINATGDAIVVDNCGYPGGEPTVTITGGTIVSDNAQSVASYAYGDGNDPVEDIIPGDSQALFSDADADGVADGYILVEVENTSPALYEVVQAVVITFVNDKGDAPEAQTIGIGRTATEPETPFADGFTFGGWFLDGAEEAFDFSTPVVADITLTADWGEAQAMVISADGDVTNYATLEQAVAAALDGETVKLLGDLTLDSRIEPNLGAGTTLVIDLGGYTLTREGTSGNGSAFDVKSGSVTITNGVIDCTQDDTAIVADGVYAITVRSGASVTLAGLDVTVDSQAGACVYPFAGASVAIESGSYFNVTGDEYQYREGWTGMAINQANVSANLFTITGGTFSQVNPDRGDDSGLVQDFLGEGYHAFGSTDSETGLRVFTVEAVWQISWVIGEETVKTDIVLRGTTAEEIAALAPADVSDPYPVAGLISIFTGWEPEITDAEGDTVYTAQFDRVSVIFRVSGLAWTSIKVADDGSATAGFAATKIEMGEEGDGFVSGYNLLVRDAIDGDASSVPTTAMTLVADEFGNLTGVGTVNADLSEFGATAFLIGLTTD